MAQNEEPAFCRNAAFTKRCIDAIFVGDLKKEGWEQLLNDCSITFNDNTEIEGLRKTLLAEMKLCADIYSRLDKNFFLTTYHLASPLGNPKPVVRASFDSLSAFFSGDFDSNTNKIKNAMPTPAKIQATIDKSSALLKNPKDKNSIDAFVKLFENKETYYPEITNNIAGLALTKDFNNKTPFLCVMLYMFYIASKRGIALELNENLIESGNINVGDMNIIFQKLPTSLDARQFITVNRFTKYRKQCDKACFLFHGVGTGKTITSLTIALSHLSDDNKFSTTADNADKTPLQILVICPQGLFFGAFQEDAEKISIYTYNPTVYSASSVKDGITYDYQFEQFDACVKVDDTSYYKIKFIGFDYLNLFNKDYALDKLGETNYDVLISDEAHNIITKKLLPKSKIGYDIAFKAINAVQEGAKIIVPKVEQGDLFEVPRREAVTEKNPTVCALNDIRFVNFVKDKIIKQSIFLTGTPIQKTPYDIVSILKFLNVKGINNSNNEKLCDDVNKVAPYNSNYFFNKLGRKGDPFYNSAAVFSTGNVMAFVPGLFAELYIAFQKLSGATVEDLEATLKKKDEPNFFDKFVGKIAPTLLLSPEDKKNLDVANLLKQNVSQQINEKFTVINEALATPTPTLDTTATTSSTTTTSPATTTAAATSSTTTTTASPATNAKKSRNNKKKGGGGEEKLALVKYVSELPEQSLILKQEMDKILSNFDGSTIINTTPVIQTIVKDTGISEENINKTLSYLYDCLNGKVPYENAVEILRNEKVMTMLNPLLGPNWVFLENPSSIDQTTSSEITIGGKKRKQTIRKKYLKRSKTRKNKYVGGLLSITDGRENDSELVLQNVNSEVFIKEIPILLELYLYNFGTTIEEQVEYFTERALQQLLPNNSASPINISDIETIKYAEQLLTTYFSLYDYKLDKPSTADIEELGGGQTAGEPSGKIKVFIFFVAGILTDLFNLIPGGEPSSIDIKGIVYNMLPRVAGFVGSHYKSGNVGVGAVGALVPEAFGLTKFIVKIGLNVASFVIGKSLGEFNLDGIIENIMPFISIYNYDYITTSIDNQIFFKELLESDPQFKLNENVNESGTTNAFPDKFIENIYFPFTQQQVRDIHSLENVAIKKSFNIGNVNLSEEKNAELSYKISNDLSNISSGVSIFDKEAKDALLNKYIKYFKKSVAPVAAEEEALGFLAKKQEQYKGVGEFSARWQLEPSVNISINAFKFKNIDLDKLADKKRIPINLSGNFVDFRKDELAVGLEDVEDIVSMSSEKEIVTQNISTIKNFYFDTLRSKLKANAGDIQKQVQFLQEKPNEKAIYKSGIQTKFENVLELLKIIRAGVIFQGEATEVSRFENTQNFDSISQFVYHPHYALVRENNNLGATGGYDDGAAEYYLPVIYPPTDDVMYGFCDFLDKKEYKYIWLNKELDPFNLDAQLKFGTIFTFPIKPYDSLGGNNPICIVLSPTHKEGFSFTFNPAIISLGLSETAGDEEQIYGRVLRKYGKDAFEGKYGKKIYQYFSGGNKDTVTLPTLTSLYSLDIKTVFRGMYDSRGYSKTTAGGSSLGSVVDSIWLSVFQGYDGLQYNTWVSSNGSREALAKLAENQSKQEYLDENFPILDLVDELQLKLLYNVKYVSLEFFKKIAIKENAKLKASFGARINPLNWWHGAPKPPFHPIDVQEMIKTKMGTITEKDEKLRETIEKSLRYCMENLNGNPKLPNFKLYTGKDNDKLNIKSALVCLDKGIVLCQPPKPTQTPPVGGNKKHKITKKKNTYKKNKRTRKYKK